MHPKLVDDLKSGAILITPTRRLATRLRSQASNIYAQSQKVWHTPGVYSLDDWLQSLWDQLEIAGHVREQLLNQTQSLLLWETIILASEVGKTLLRPYSSAKIAFEAWKTLNAWQALAIIDQANDNPDQQEFQNWAKRYQQWLNDHNCIDLAQLPLRILSKITGQHTLLLFGFEELSPLMQYFCETLQKQNWTIEYCSPEPCLPATLVRKAFHNCEQEQLAVAQWAKQLIDQKKTNIAIVVPDLANQRNALYDLFKETMDPLSVCLPMDSVNAHFNISAAIPLIQYPLIKSALELLKGMAGAQPYGAWASDARIFLTQRGWPGERPLNSIEYQLVKRWNSLLEEMGHYDFVLPSAKSHEFIALLEKLAANIPFQPENKNAPIQILGVLEAAGQTFDYLWIMGMHSEAWPAPAEPNPFLPLNYQRQHNMPHASAQRQLNYAAHVTTRFKQSANMVIFSYPLQEKEKQFAVSELISDLPLENNLSITNIRCEQFFGKVTLDKVEDNRVQALGVLENRASTHTLVLQATCPFKAFAEIRLKALPLEEEKIWFEPSEGGIIVHAILETFWKQVRSHANLCALSTFECEIIIENLIELELAHRIRPNTPLLYIAAEKTRLRTILLDFIALEKNRPAFTVEAIESKVKVTIGPLDFSLRIDRIDRDSMGNMIVIDYKTGQFNVFQIWGERPLAPQLPLYFLAMENQPTALLAAKLHPKDCHYEGVSDIPTGILGIETLSDQKDATIPVDWQALGEYWHNNLAKVAWDYKEGNATVDPIKRNVCDYCEQKPLCRINDVIEHI